MSFSSPRRCRVQAEIKRKDRTLSVYFYGKTKKIVEGRLKRKPVRDYLLRQGRFAHFTDEDIDYFQKKTDEMWEKWILPGVIPLRAEEAAGEQLRTLAHVKKRLLREPLFFALKRHSSSTLIFLPLLEKSCHDTPLSHKIASPNTMS